YFRSASLQCSQQSPPPLPDWVPLREWRGKTQLESVWVQQGHGLFFAGWSIDVRTKLILKATQTRHENAMPLVDRLLVCVTGSYQRRCGFGETHSESAFTEQHLFRRDEHDAFRCALHRHKFLEPSQCFIEIRIICHHFSAAFKKRAPLAERRWEPKRRPAHFSAVVVLGLLPEPIRSPVPGTSLTNPTACESSCCSY